MLRLSVDIEPGRLSLDKRLTRAVMRAAGAEVAAVARAMIRGSAGSGRFYRGPGGSAKAYRGGYKKGGYTASSPGQPPVSVTGTLARSISVRPFKSGEGVTIKDTMFYALFLEKGARGGGGGGKSSRNKRGGAGTVRVLEPRPFLTAALAQREASIAQRVQASIADGLKFERIKV